MSGDCSISVDGFGFSPQEIAACAEKRGLLSMEIELSLACNFRCPYCYLTEEHQKTALTLEQACAIITQAKELGARRIIILGGEPMVYPRLREVIEFISQSGLETEIFTNGVRMTVEMARFMYEHRVAVVLKLNTLNRELQNRLTGHPRGYDIIHEALENLRQVGYPSPGHRMAISTVICNDNFLEMPALWRWIRTQQMAPYVEMITPQGGAKINEQWLTVPSARVKQLFDELATIDREEFGRHWDPQPPLVANVCLRHQFSCLVTASGTVFSCVGITIPLGNVHEMSLRSILQDSEVLENLRDYRNKIKEPCRSCFKAENCYGCRGAAYQLTGDYLAADPLCWHAQDACIDKLPVRAEKLIPHGPGMRVIDRLLTVGERKATTEFTIPARHQFVNANGQWDETAYVEMIAQTLAACHGFHLSAAEQKLHRGLLLGIKSMTVSGQARVGDCLHVRIHKLARINQFGVAEGVITHADGREIARGQVKVWQTNADPAEVLA